MEKSIIYADFNGIRESTRTPGWSAIPLDTFGSLKDLSNQRIRLKENMALTVYMDSDEREDLEVDGTVY